jgi:hypothetical protein
MMDALRHRIIWVFGLGYFAFYAPYSGVIKLVTTGRVAGVPAELHYMELLPAVIVGTLVGFVAFLTLFDWWRYAMKPTPILVASGIGTAVIIGTTTIAYSFSGVSIVLALLMMRAGTLTLAPLVDRVMERRVRWFCWAALFLSIAAVGVALSQIDHYRVTAAVAVNLAAYLSGYVVRLPAMTKAAKIDDKEWTKRYFVTELLVAMAALAAFPFAVALLFRGGVAAATWRGMTSFWSTPALVPALAIGVLYAGLYVFGTLIYLDRRENTFCIPLNRGASLLAGVAVSYVLAAMTTLPRPPVEQLVAASLVLLALTLLSPLHHVVEVAADAAKLAADRRRRRVRSL